MGNSNSWHSKIGNILAIVGLLFALPAIYFFTGSFLKYEMNLLPNVEIVVPPPMIMVGGLLLAIAMNGYSLLRLRPRKSQETFIKTPQTFNSWNVWVFGIGLLYLVLLLGYVVVENLAERRAAIMDTSSNELEEI